MVSGGYDWSRFDSTEVYGEDRVWRTVSGKLPLGTGELRATTISGSRVLIFGNYYHFTYYLLHTGFIGGYFGYYRKNIIEYNHKTEEWQEISAMKEARAGHAVTVVSWEDYADWCILN